MEALHYSLLTTHYSPWRDSPWQERGVVLAVKEENGKAKFGFIRCAIASK